MPVLQITVENLFYGSITFPLPIWAASAASCARVMSLPSCPAFCVSELIFACSSQQGNDITATRSYFAEAHEKPKHTCRRGMKQTRRPEASVTRPAHRFVGNGTAHWDCDRQAQIVPSVSNPVVPGAHSRRVGAPWHQRHWAECKNTHRLRWSCGVFHSRRPTHPCLDPRCPTAVPTWGRRPE